MVYIRIDTYCKFICTLQDGGFDSEGAIIAGVILVLIITIMCVIGIMYISKWGGIEKK